ncbi:hypothetical protein LEP1GSC047_0153, partial [Leptospira inadai serovar Lyme str. 10]
MPNSSYLLGNQPETGPWLAILWWMVHFGISLGFLMCLGQIVIERKTALNRLLALLFASIGIFQACSASILSGFYQTMPLLSLAYLP